MVAENKKVHSNNTSSMIDKLPSSMNLSRLSKSDPSCGLPKISLAPKLKAQKQEIAE